MELDGMFADVASREAALRNSIEALREIVSLYDGLGLILPAVHTATALHAAHAALEEERDKVPVGDPWDWCEPL